MGIIGWIILGGLAGWVGSKIMKTDESMGVLANIIVGIIGAVVGGFIVTMFGADQGVNGFNIWSFLVALLGSIILLWIVKAFRKQ